MRLLPQLARDGLLQLCHGLPSRKIRYVHFGITQREGDHNRGEHGGSGSHKGVRNLDLEVLHQVDLVRSRQTESATRNSLLELPFASPRNRCNGRDNPGAYTGAGQGRSTAGVDGQAIEID